MKRDEAIGHMRACLAAEDVSERHMMGSLIFMVGEHMCCGVGDGRILLRLGAAGAARAAEAPHVTQMQMGERVAKGYVHVAAPGYADPAALQAWVGHALAYVRTLPPKKKRK